jgi:hypothetical protein
MGDTTDATPQEEIAPQEEAPHQEEVQAPELSYPGAEAQRPFQKGFAGSPLQQVQVPQKTLIERAWRAVVAVLICIGLAFSFACLLRAYLSWWIMSGRAAVMQEAASPIQH